MRDLLADDRASAISQSPCSPPSAQAPITVLQFATSLSPWVCAFHSPPAPRHLLPLLLIVRIRKRQFPKAFRCLVGLVRMSVPRTFLEDLRPVYQITDRVKKARAFRAVISREGHACLAVADHLDGAVGLERSSRSRRRSSSSSSAYTSTGSSFPPPLPLPPLFSTRRQQ